MVTWLQVYGSISFNILYLINFLIFIIIKADILLKPGLDYFSSESKNIVVDYALDVVKPSFIVSK